MIQDIFTIGTHSKSWKEHSNTAVKGILKLLNSDFEYSSQYAWRNYASLYVVEREHTLSSGFGHYLLTYEVISLFVLFDRTLTEI